MTVNTRFAPSPTGWLHIGGVRTALYSWLYARKHKGKFFLRIDDTDTSRSTDEFKDSIISALKQLGLEHDDEITYQSQRFSHYIDKVEELLNKDLAYYDKVEKNEKTRETDLALAYDNRLNKEGHVIRFRNQRENIISISDSVHGEIKFDPKVFFDVVILRSNGVPTYNLTSVVDDIDMEITHLIRGDDHLSNLPVQVNLFKSFEANVPIFCHLPMIHGTDGKRLSKRDGALDIMDYKSEGYLSEALLNYIVRLGWAKDEIEKFTMKELIDFFDLPMSNVIHGQDNQKNIKINNNITVATPICFDIAFPRTVRKMNQSSDFIINISNDTWFGSSIGPHHHLEIARIRSIENDKWTIRATNDGYSAFISNKGTIVDFLSKGDVGILEGYINLRESRSFYNEYGYIFSYVIIFISLLMFLIVCFKSKKV